MAKSTRANAMQSNHAAMVDVLGIKAPVRKRIKSFNEKMVSTRYSWELFAKETYPNRGYFIVESRKDGSNLRIKIKDNLNIIQLLEKAWIRKEYPDLREAQEKAKYISWSLVTGDATQKEIETQYVTVENTKVAEPMHLAGLAFGMMVSPYSHGIRLSLTERILQTTFGENYQPADYSTQRKARLKLPSGIEIVLENSSAISEEYYYTTSLIDRKKVTYMELCREIMACVLDRVPSMKLIVAKYLHTRKKRAQDKKLSEVKNNNNQMLALIEKAGISTYMTQNIKTSMSVPYDYKIQKLDWLETTCNYSHVTGMNMRLTAQKEPASLEMFTVSVRAFFIKNTVFSIEDIHRLLGLENKRRGFNPDINVWFYTTSTKTDGKPIKFKEKKFSDNIAPEFERLKEALFFTGNNSAFLIIENVGLTDLKVHYVFYHGNLAFAITYALELSKDAFTLV